MIPRLRTLFARSQGSAAIEFAIAAPVLLGLIFGVIQFGMLFMANAGLQHAVEEGARYATIYPRPDESQIIAKVNANRFGLRPDAVTGPTVSFGEDNGTDYAQITMSYQVPMNFVFYKVPGVTLTKTRRAYRS